MPEVDTFRPEPGTLRTRDEIPDKYKWDLGSICPDWDEWTAAYKRLEVAVKAFPAFQGTLAAGPDQLLAAFRAMDDMGALSYRVWYFAALHYDEDQRDNTINGQCVRCRGFFCGLHVTGREERIFENKVLVPRLASGWRWQVAHSDDGRGASSATASGATTARCRRPLPTTGPSPESHVESK